MSMVKTMPLSADVHPHPQIWIGFMGLAKLSQYLHCYFINYWLTH